MTPALEQIKALLRYGRHDPDCAYCQDSMDKPRPHCTCGFDTALQALRDEAGDAVAEIVEAAERDGAFLSHCNVRLRVYNGYAPAVGDHLYTRPAPAAEAAPPSAPTVDDVVSALVDLAAKVREERASYTLTHFDNDARSLIRRLSAPVPQEGADDLAGRIADAVMGEGLNDCDSPTLRRVIRDAIAAAPAQGVR